MLGHEWNAKAYTTNVATSGVLTYSELKRAMDQFRALAPIVTEVAMPSKEAMADVLSLLPAAKQVSEFGMFSGIKIFVDDELEDGTIKYVWSDGRTEVFAL